MKDPCVTQFPHNKIGSLLKKKKEIMKDPNNCLNNLKVDFLAL